MRDVGSLGRRARDGWSCCSPTSPAALPIDVDARTHITAQLTVQRTGNELKLCSPDSLWNGLWDMGCAMTVLHGYGLCMAVLYGLR